jgi:8-oxo-dGTP pyrophosphatase MutT (NUDIX family)
MIRRIIGWIGIAAFWITWPALWIYFRISNQRSRVLVMCDGEVLLVRSIVTSSARWSLPGGGRGKHETPEAAATRELKEELGIDAAESALKSLGTQRHAEAGIAYMADYFVLELTTKPELTLEMHEILYARWWPLADIRGRMLTKDAAYVLKQYLPERQESLL